MKTLFVGPSDPGEFIWGAGPLFVLPTAMDDRLRTDKWGIGIQMLLLKWGNYKRSQNQYLRCFIKGGQQ